MFEWGIQYLTLNSDDVIPMDPSSTLIIIGPNNSGKSRTLREIEAILNNPASDDMVVIQNIQRFHRGDEEGFRLWLQQHYPLVTSGRQRLFVTKDAGLNESQVPELWHRLSQGQGTGPGDRFLCQRLDTETRLQLGNPRSSINPYTDVPQAYIHILQSDEPLKERVSAEVRKAFGEDLIINWVGPVPAFHVGNEPQRALDRDRVSKEHFRSIDQLPRLQTEGDGIRSFVGTLLASQCGAQPILLIDEPETFLHPPQIRRLAGVLGRNAERLNRQVIIATHSSEVIRGALNESGRVAICRLTRRDGLNYAALLPSDKIQELWSKPLLRSAAAIDGVFHVGVVISEADSDSRFYEAIVRRLESTQRLQGPLDFYFVQGGGKGELSTLANAYIGLKVPVAVIADLDLLRNRTEFIKVFSSLGGEFNQVEQLYNTTASALNDLPPIKSVADFLRGADEVLTQVRQQNDLDTTHRKALAQLIKDSGDWSAAKRYGILKLRGGAHEACAELLNACNGVGLFLVPSGELESWWRGGPSDKNEWFLAAIESIYADRNSFTEASDFMVAVCNYLSQ